MTDTNNEGGSFAVENRPDGMLVETVRHREILIPWQVAIAAQTHNRFKDDDINLFMEALISKVCAENPAFKPNVPGITDEIEREAGRMAAALLKDKSLANPGPYREYNGPLLIPGKN